MKRATWLGAGLVLGAGGTLWARRRVEALGARLRTNAVADDLAAGLARGARVGRRRVRDSIAAGAEVARRRESELRLELARRDRDHRVAMRRADVHGGALRR